MLRRETLLLVALGLVGWMACGAMVVIGREVISTQATLILHAIGAPVVFGLLSFVYAWRFPGSKPGSTALAFVGIVVALDALVVAPLFERSYAMFRSFLGTWLPFALIFAASWGGGRSAARPVPAAPPSRPPGSPPPRR